MLHPTDFFDLSDPFTAALFAGCDYVWEAIQQIGRHVARLTEGKQTILGQVAEGAYLSDKPVYIGQGAQVDPGAFIQGPAYIAAGARVAHGAFVRENVILLPGSLLGHTSEAKNSILLTDAHAPHFSYIGDSILGHRVNLGAGTKLSNLGVLSAKDPISGKRPTIRLLIEGEEYDTGLAKFGAILGDEAQTGCNSVLNPGCVVGRRSLIYANVSLRKGYYPADTIVKLRQTQQIVQRRSAP